MADKSLCFIHVGKTGGSSFSAQFADGQKVVPHPPSLPSLRIWREVHTRKRSDYGDCDLFVAWVRDPIERAVSAYNMAFDPTFRNDWIATTQNLLRAHGDLNSLLEEMPTNADALRTWRDVEHLRFDLAWYFTSDDGGNAVDPGQHSASSLHTKSRLADETFARKLVFVGALECYDEGAARFARLFDVAKDYLDSHPVVHQRRRHADAFDSSRLSGEARKNLREYLEPDYGVLQSLSMMGLIKCQKLDDLIWR